jgi:hypothetical protein
MSRERIASIAVALIVFVALACVPVIPLVYLGETSWEQVSYLYPAFVVYVSEAGSYHREIFFCLAVFTAHLGLAIGVGWLTAKYLFRSRSRARDVEV